MKLYKKELEEYETEMTTEDDTREWLEFELERTRKAALEKGRAEGLSEGEAKGMAKGAREAALETARRMLAKGIGQGIVAECTGLSPEETASL